MNDEDDTYYSITLSLTILKQLGIKLYSNVPAVLSEIVANSWDADAEWVRIRLDNDKGEIEIIDNGIGMTRDEINERYLHVGYDKRRIEGSHSKKGRPFMGRKGIGKLSLFSMARMIEIHTLKGGKKNGLSMDIKEIEEKITAKEGGGTYHPPPIPEKDLSLEELKKDGHGTKIILKDLKKNIRQTAVALKTRVARRFSILGEEHDFEIEINEEKVKIEDRDYFHKLQYIWIYEKGIDAMKYVNYCSAKGSDKLEKHFERPKRMDDTNYEISGWIGTVKLPAELKEEEESLNKIIIMVRGKLAQEDILKEIKESRLFAQYLIGEINAEFLDDDEQDDIATSSRQEIIKDDPRYIELKKWITKEVSHVGNDWTKLRQESGTKKALKIKEVAEWYKNLPNDYKRRAENLFGKLNQMTLEPEQRKMIFKSSIIAFESYRYKKNLDALDNLTPENLIQLSEIFVDLDDIEATLYHQIIQERLKIIKKFQMDVDDDVLEKIIQEYLYDHLWLLEPSWERTTDSPRMEKTIKKEFEGIEVNLSKEEKEGRVDIRYKRITGMHIIIELKRAGRCVNDHEIMKQVQKYRTALEKFLEKIGKSHEPIEVISIVGKELKEWTDPQHRAESERSLWEKKIRVITYQKLIADAYSAYDEFIKRSEVTGRVYKLIQSIEDSDFE